MSSNPPPKGRNYPFAQRGSAFWEKCHVTYDQAVDMFYDQTAMQQYLGHDPIVYSTVYKRVKYPSIFDAQKAYSQDQNSLYQKKEQEQLELEAKGFEEFKKKNDAIRGRLNPTENGAADPLGRPLKPMGDLSKGTFDQGTIENAHEPSDRIETKTPPAPSSQQATDSAKNDSEDELILKSSLKQSKPLNELAAGKFNALKKGSIETEEIKKVQQALIDCGFNLGKFGADGDFGRATEGAVKQFQAHYKPTHTTHKSYQFGNVDGIVDKNTILALDEAIKEGWKFVDDEMDQKWLTVPKGQVTFNAEGNDIEGDIYFTRIPHIPNNNGIVIGSSGITFGRGLDLGSRTQGDIEQIFSKVSANCKPLSSSLLEWLKKGAGLKGQDAYHHYKNLDKQVPKLEQVLTRKQQHFLFLEIYPFYEKETERLLTKPDVRRAYDKKSVIVWNQLSSSIREVLVDLTYRGDNISSTRKMIIPSLVTDINDKLNGCDSKFYLLMKNDKVWVDRLGVNNNRYKARHEALLK